MRSRLLFAISALLVLACGREPRDVDDDSADTSTSGSGGNTSSVGSGAGAPCGHAGDAEPGGSLSGITAAHNQVRCAVDSGDALPNLQWSSELAAVAQAYADQLASQGCDLNHSSGPYGENLFWGSGSYTPADVIGAWADEISCFNYTEFPDSCGCVCGHYTQIVWRNTTQVGCGIGACPGGGEVWVCNYDPPGNFLGQLPY